MTGTGSVSKWASHSRVDQSIRRVSIAGVLIVIAVGFYACDPRKDEIQTFPHQPHLEFMMSCDMCHEVTAERMTMPTLFSCTTCHELDAPEIFGRCTDCHDQHNVVMTEDSVLHHEAFFMSFIPDNMKDLSYNHANYPVESDDECLACHQNISTSMGSSFANIPSMQVSMDFHDLKGFSNECSVCHTELDTHTAPLSHDSRWPQTHGRMMVFEDQRQCLLCHQEDSCFTCHSIEKPRDHNNLFRRKTHGIQASFDRARCMVCHRNDECLTCHLSSASPVSPAPYHTPDASCLSCHSPGAALGPGPRPSERFMKPMPHRMMMGVSSQKCMECHMF